MRTFRSLFTTGFTAGLLALLIPAELFAEEITLTATRDTFLRNGAPNTNEGGNKKLSVRRVGRRRALLGFDLSSIASQVPAGQEVVGAELRLFITNNNKAWGKSGGVLGAHELSTNWTEGNGSNATVPKVDKDTGEEADQSSNRGSGGGVTWNCATDSNVKNTRPNCTKKWKGGTFVNTPLSVVSIKNNTLGEIVFDVSNTVFNFLNATNTQNFGWLIKKTNLLKAGGVWFASSEASSNKPKLVVTTGYTFSLSGTAEVPPLTTTATGACAVALTTNETLIEVACTHNVPNVSMAHIHDAATGVDGPVVCELSTTATRVSGSCAATADLITKLHNGGLYVNIHSPANPGGEIRGQIQ